MFSKILLIGLFVCGMILMSWKHDRRKKVVFFGDSITQQGAGPGGYITRIDSLLKLDGIEDKYQLIGAGVSGNKVYDLYLRMEEDVLSKSPDIVVIYVGINDVWHKQTSGTGTDYDKYGKFYTAMVKKLQAIGTKVIVCTPSVIGERTDNSNAQDGDLNLYSKWIRDFAATNNLPLVDLRKAFIEYNLQHNPGNNEKGILTVDRVHLNPQGNILVANQIWDAIKQVQ